jgi:hypothetical protein
VSSEDSHTEALTSHVTILRHRTFKKVTCHEMGVLSAGLPYDRTGVPLEEEEILSLSLPLQAKERDSPKPTLPAPWT